ncbi:Uu.00g060890.m01.CDS01 [Anthostomella pinea]|uniref:Uu.00g060890.m01.CDS01 n=1 Tax=Anthostomella pinea TaxID=933095 RepID=A0AAI8YMI8_9PEZI|nr:Uu.00g060890.m01.CDS01 [Anthostomella pinea]
MSLSKQRISSPLEAGRSILDTHNLPPHLTEALEYTSKRLARKAIHVTLLVIQNTQLPSTPPPRAMPASPPATPDYSTTGFTSPVRFTSPVTGLRQLVRRGTNASTASSASSITTASESATTSPTFSPPPSDGLPSPRRWILPPTPGSPPPRTPMTPHTPSSTATTTASSSASQAQSLSQSLSLSLSPSSPLTFGIRLIPTAPLSPKAEKTLRATLSKAEHKFRTRLPPTTTAAAAGLHANLLHRSVAQNEALFAGEDEGLVLLGLDRLYCFKAALAAYARASIAASHAAAASVEAADTPLGSPGLSNHPITTGYGPGTGVGTGRSGEDSTRLEDAVDSMRRLVLANGGRPVPKSEVYRCYDWMGVYPRALADVEKMYRRAYGGPERRGPFEVVPVFANTNTNTNTAGEREQEREGEFDRQEVVMMAVKEFKIGTPPPPKSQMTPVLKLNTNIPTSPRLVRPKPTKPAPQTQPVETQSETQTQIPHQLHELQIRIDDIESSESPPEEYEDEDGDRTARPLADGPLRSSLLWQNANALLLAGGMSIDEMLSPCDYRASQQMASPLGPMTPNGYDDISPVTRGEWGFLFKGAGWTGARTAAVETC